MNRQQIIDDMRKQLGFAPDFLTSFPDQMLEHIWESMKNFELGQTAIPNKYKELMGLAIASQMQCPYCVHFHTEAAKFWGATDQEISEAVTMAFWTAGMSTYIAGTGYDLNKFKQETTRILDHVRSQAKAQGQRAA